MKIKYILSILLIVASLWSCNKGDDNQDKKRSKKILASSTGSINGLSIIIDDSLWKSEVGEEIRNKLAAPVNGLPQEEPLFNLSHIPPAAFSSFMRSKRIFMHVQTGDEDQLFIAKNIYAKPQTGVVVKAKDKATLVKLIRDNSDKIIKSFKQEEIKANQERIAKSLKSDEVLKQKFGLSLKFPSVYRYAVEEENFVWLRKDIQHGSMEILIYEVPMEMIDKDTNVVNSIVQMRDSIGEKYVPGPTEGSHMITERAYSPFVFETEIDRKFTYLTKGTWEVKGAYMAGPFVNYAIRDEKNKRYLVLEGFVFKPQTPTKRNNIFELQAIFRSAKLE